MMQVCKILLIISLFIYIVNTSMYDESKQVTRARICNYDILKAIYESVSFLSLHYKTFFRV